MLGAVVLFSLVAAGSGRIIPISDALLETLIYHAPWFENRFGAAPRHLYLFPFGSPVPQRSNQARDLSAIVEQGANAHRCRLPISRPASHGDLAHGRGRTIANDHHGDRRARVAQC